MMCGYGSGGSSREPPVHPSAFSEPRTRTVNDYHLPVNFNLTDVQRSWREKAHSLASDLPSDAASADVVMAAARVGLLDPRADLLAASVAVEASAYDAASAGVSLALHSGVLLALGQDDSFTS